MIGLKNIKYLHKKLSKNRIVAYIFAVLFIIIIQSTININTNLNANDLLSVFQVDSITLIENNNYYDSSHVYINTGIASSYAKKFHKRKTASGERYNMNEYSAAHKALPFGTVLRVKNLETDSVTLVRINDRGPFIKNRIIDLSSGSTKDVSGTGVFKVKVEGFVPNNSTIEIDTLNDNTYLAYSFSCPIAPIDRSYITIVDSTYDFSEAVTYYKDLVNNSDEISLILIPAKEYLSNQDYIFYIAFLKSEYKTLKPLFEEITKK